MSPLPFPRYPCLAMFVHASVKASSMSEVSSSGTDQLFKRSSIQALITGTVSASPGNDCSTEFKTGVSVAAAITTPGKEAFFREYRQTHGGNLVGQFDARSFQRDRSFLEFRCRDGLAGEREVLEVSETIDQSDLPPENRSRSDVRLGRTRKGAKCQGRNTHRNR
jgi:hypothetical protein